MNLQKNSVATRLFALLAKVSGWLQNLPNRVTPPPFRLLQIGSAFWQSRVLYVAARLNLASVLGNDSLAASALAAKVSANPDALNRLLRFLVAMGIFEQVSPRHFRNNKFSDCLRDDNPHNVRAMILMHNSREMSLPWYEQLEAGITAGEVPFKLAHGEELFGYMDSHPQFTTLFNRAMDSVEALSGDSFATDFDWQRFERIIDLGGGVGSKSVTILQHHPQLHAHVVDAAPMIEQAQGYWQNKIDNSVLQRLSFSAGDVLSAVPPAKTAKDIYFLSAVFHGFDDATCVRALRNIAQASAGSGARIAVMELVVDADRPDALSSAFDMQMLMGTRGRERTLDEWRNLFGDGGMRLEQVVNLRGFGKILVVQP
jgi:hypothetical protein